MSCHPNLATTDFIAAYLLTTFGFLQELAVVLSDILFCARAFIRSNIIRVVIRLALGVSRPGPDSCASANGGRTGGQSPGLGFQLNICICIDHSDMGTHRTRTSELACGECSRILDRRVITGDGVTRAGPIIEAYIPLIVRKGIVDAV